MSSELSRLRKTAERLLFARGFATIAALMAVTCPGCGSTFALGDDAAGQRFRCNTCGTTFEVPPPAAVPAIAVKTASGRPAKRRLEWGGIVAGLVVGSACTFGLWGCLGAVSKPTPEFITGGAYSASRIYYSWRQAPEETAEIYLGQRFNIYGSVKNREDGGFVIVVSDSTRLNFAARCIMRPTEKNLDLVQFHSLVQIRGTCRGPRSKRDDEIVFEDCELQLLGQGQEDFHY